MLSSVLDPARDAAPVARTTRPAGGVGPPHPLVLSERDLRSFYDPAGRRGDRPVTDLLKHVAGSRVPCELPPLGRLTEFEVILVEALHAGLATGAGIGPGDAGVVLPVPPAWQRAIAAAVDRYADTVAAAVLAVADDLARDLHLHRLRQRIADRQHPARPARLELAGRVLAAVAHSGAVRRSGRDYYSHPDETASILSAAWRRLARAEHDPRLQVGRFLAYCHDGFEDALDPVGGYLSTQPVLVSPRVARAVLEHLGVPDAAEVARVLLLMTRTRATDGSRMDYLDYLDRGIAEGAAYFLLTKAGDVHHNLSIDPERIDPADHRAPARYRKRELYRRAADQLRGAADGHDHQVARAVHTTFAVSAAEVGPSLRSDPESVRRLAAAVRDRVRPAGRSAD